MTRKKKPETIGFRIKAIRLSKGWTQEMLAKKLKMRQSHVSHLESGEFDPRVSTLRRVAKALRVKVSELID